jgi:hypothetical protein
MHNLEVWIDDNKYDNIDRYTEIERLSSSYKQAAKNLSDYENKTCSEYGTIAKDSMVCTFKIYG